MKCQHCGGLVEWRGPLSNLTHTECVRCGAVDSQEPEAREPDPDCYGCLGTGEIKGFGVRPGAPCPCLDAEEEG